MRSRFASVLMILLWSAPVWAVDPVLPRYQLTVGRQLNYSGDSTFTYQNGTMEWLETCQLTTIAQNPDGSYRLIVRTSERKVQNSTGHETTSPNVEKERVRYSRIDIHPDGRLVETTPSDLPTETPIVLPPMPADVAQIAGTWRNDSAMPGSAQVFTSLGAPADGKWMLKSASEGVFKDIYGMDDGATYQFDIAKGMVVSIATTQKQDYAFHGSGAGQTHLDSDRTLSADEMKTLSADAQTLLDAQAAIAKMGEAITARTDAAKVRSEMTAALTLAMNHVTTPEIKAALDEQRSQVDREVAYSIEDAKRIDGLVGKPLADVLTTDMDGHARKLSAFRGKVLVLDFWYRGCGWCVRAMPQLKQIADDFKDRPFALIGINTDRDAADARFVVDALKLNYPTLRIDIDTRNKLNIHAFPSLLVVDRNGVVRDFQEGFSLHLREDLEKKIRPLLDKN